MKRRDFSILFNMFVPGLGHAYLGLVRRGLAFALAGPALALASCVLPEVGVVPMLAVASVALIGTRAAAMFDGYRVPEERHRPIPTPAILGLGVGMFVALQASAVIARALLVEAFKVPSASMAPTLLVGDHIFVDKHAYRKRDPVRGETAVFAFPENTDHAFIKRVVGLPGDTVQFRAGRPVINGWEVPSCSVGEWSYVDEVDGTSRGGEIFVEYLGDRAYLTVYDGETSAASAEGPFVVKPGEYFVLGDNRDNAHDSRMWWGGAGGGVPRDHFRGAARLVWFSKAPSPKPRMGIDVAGSVVAPAPELQAGVDRCLASRPSNTTPPPPAAAAAAAAAAAPR